MFIDTIEIVKKEEMQVVKVPKSIMISDENLGLPTGNGVIEIVSGAVDINTGNKIESYHSLVDSVILENILDVDVQYSRDQDGNPQKSIKVSELVDIIGELVDMIYNKQV